ncbi:MAG: hypothetical protein HRT98_03440 [Mycoplasmatales bacterium]|nr:hypothetical protein [Mycoplasmatales bacterium]
MKSNKRKMIKVITSSALTTAIAIPTVISCGTTGATTNKNDNNVFIKRPTYESLGIKGFNGHAKITHLPSSPKEGILIIVNKKKDLRNQDKITITYIVDNKHDLMINNKKRIVFQYFVHDLKQEPIENVKILKPKYSSLNILGVSGSAILTTPPQDTQKYKVSINRTKDIKNKDKIEITYISTDPTKYSINGKSQITFTYVVSGLAEVVKVVDLKVNKQTLGITVTGISGKGKFIIPKIAHAIVTATQNTNLSNGQQFTITVRGKQGYTINGKSQDSFTFVVKNLQEPLINQIISKPNIVFTGTNGSGTFVMPQIANMSIKASKTSGLSNGEWINLTITANQGYLINGKHKEVIQYQVNGLAPIVAIKNVSIIHPQKQGYDINNLNSKEIFVGNQKTLVAWFGKSPAESPLVFMFGHKKFNHKFFKNAHTEARPFIDKSELKEFIGLFLKHITHGAEITAFGVISFDNEEVIKNNQHLGGFVRENGLFAGNPEKFLPLKPKNISKSLMFINSGLANWENSLYGFAPNFNSVKEKFDSVFGVMQHEYGHILNHFQTYQKPTFIGRHKKIAPNEIMHAGIHNGYRPQNYEADYLPRYMVEKIAKMLGVDINDPDVDKDTNLLELLRKKQEYRNVGGDKAYVNKQLALWTMRVMLGDFNNNYPGYLNRNKAFLYKGQVVSKDFNIEYRRFEYKNNALFSKITRIWNDYSGGFDEMLTRLFTNMMFRSKTYLMGETTLSSLLAGWDPYYTYKTNAFNFQDQNDGKGMFDWLRRTQEVDPTLINAIQKNGPNLTISTSFGMFAKKLIKEGKGFRKPLKDMTKRDNMIEFWRDTVMGYNKTISTFIKESNEEVGNSGELYGKDPWSLNILGGWTKKMHQYIILNPEDTTDKIVNHQSTVFPIQDAHGSLSFRGKPEEDWDNRSIKYDKKSWYVDFSSRYMDVMSMRNHLSGQKFSFWDDNNNDGVIQKNEITLIPWTEVRSLYPKSNRVFTGGTIQNTWGPNPKIKVRGQEIGETWTGSIADLYNALILRRSDNGSVELQDELKCS